MAMIYFDQQVCAIDYLYNHKTWSEFDKFIGLMDTVHSFILQTLNGLFG